MEHIRLSDPNPFLYYEKQVKDIKGWRRRYNTWDNVYSVGLWKGGGCGALDLLYDGIYFTTDSGPTLGGYVIKRGFTYRVYYTYRGWISRLVKGSLDIVALREEPLPEEAEGKLHVKVRLS